MILMDAPVAGSSAAFVMAAALRWVQMKRLVHEARQLRSTFDSAEHELRIEQLKYFKDGNVDPAVFAAATDAVETARGEWASFHDAHDPATRLDDAARAVRSPMQSLLLTSLMLLPSMTFVILAETATADAEWASDAIEALASMVP